MKREHLAQSLARDSAKVLFHRLVTRKNELDDFEHKQLVEYVQRHGDTGLESPNSYPVLHTACQRNNVELIDACLLHSKNGNVNTKSFGNYPLHCLVESYNRNLPNRLEALIEHGADINVQGYCDRTPLMSALVHVNIYSNIDESLIKILLSLGASVDIADENGKSPLMQAVYNDNCNIAQLIIEKGAALSAKDGCGHEVMHYVKSPEMVFLLHGLGASTQCANFDGEGPLAVKLNSESTGFNDQCADALFKIGCGLSGVAWDVDSTTAIRFKSVFARVHHQLDRAHKAQLLVGLLCEGGNMASWAAEQLAQMTPAEGVQGISVNP